MISMRKWLISGLLVVVPVAITVWVLRSIIGALDQTLLILPIEWRPTTLLGHDIPGFGALLTLFTLLVVGAIASLSLIHISEPTRPY